MKLWMWFIALNLGYKLTLMRETFVGRVNRIYSLSIRFTPSSQKTKENRESDWTSPSLNYGHLPVAPATAKVKRPLLPDLWPSSIGSRRCWRERAIYSSWPLHGGGSSCWRCCWHQSLSPSWGVSFVVSFVTILIFFSFFLVPIMVDCPLSWFRSTDFFLMFFTLLFVKKILKLINAMMLYVSLALKGVFVYML